LLNEKVSGKIDK